MRLVCEPRIICTTIIGSATNAAARTGQIQNTHSWSSGFCVSSSNEENTAMPVDRAGFSAAPVTGAATAAQAPYATPMARPYPCRGTPCASVIRMAVPAMIMPATTSTTIAAAMPKDTPAWDSWP